MKDIDSIHFLKENTVSGATEHENEKYSCYLTFIPLIHWVWPKLVTSKKEKI